MQETFITPLGESIVLNTDLDTFPIEKKTFKYTAELNIPPIWKKLTFTIVGYLEGILYAKDSMNFVREIGTIDEVQQLFKNKILEFVE